MRLFSDLHNAFLGIPIAVLGGGPSLPDDVERLPEGALLIGVNHHAWKIGIAVDFLAFLDTPTGIPDLRDAVYRHVGKRISTNQHTDFEMSFVDYWDGGMSSTFATWCACYMGGDPVLLCGMDCYQGPDKYCHAGDMPDHPAHHYPLENHLAAWRTALGWCERSNVIRAMSGPLMSIFGGF